MYIAEIFGDLVPEEAPESRAPHPKATLNESLLLPFDLQNEYSTGLDYPCE